jgi:glycosyltransferase involved in cell wall biosynthesis
MHSPFGSAPLNTPAAGAGPAGYDVILTCNYSPWSRYSGGAQKSVHMIASELARQGVRVAVVYSKAPWERIAPPETPGYAVHWAAFFAFRPGISSPLRFLNGLAFYFKVGALSRRRTVIHANGDEGSLFGFIANKRKFVYTNRYPEFPGFLAGRNWRSPGAWIAVLFREPRFVAIALGIRRADRVTVTSGYSQVEAAKAFGLREADLRVVPNGVDPVFLDLPLADGKGRGVLFFGRLTRAKGSDLALEAYARLPAALREAHPLRILGVGPLREALEARAKALNVKVEFPGWKRGADLAREILASAVVCVPSREESFGNTVAETLALGQSLVSMRCGSIPEVAGPWGSLADPEDVAGIAAGLEQALIRPMSAEARGRQREFVRQRYSWASTARSFRGLYATIRPARRQPGGSALKHAQPAAPIVYFRHG